MIFFQTLLDVCFFIVGGDDYDKHFDLHPLRHELIAVKPLVRHFFMKISVEY